MMIACVTSHIPVLGIEHLVHYVIIMSVFLKECCFFIKSEEKIKPSLVRRRLLDTLKIQ
jgi:hypothetical protein